jgi:hypothetical protein
LVSGVGKQRGNSAIALVQEWAARIGRRNIAYVVFVSLRVPFSALMEVAGPQGSDTDGGIMAAIILWSMVSLIFFTANAASAIARLIRGQSAAKPLIASLPILCIVVPLLLEPFFVR